MTALTGWENFYVIVGSAAGALIGLQFVVVTLIADSPTLRVAEGVLHLRRRRSFISESCCCCQRL
jgi:hypothetical protein